MREIPFTRPSITWRERKAANRCLKEFLRFGPKSLEFEQRLKDYTGTEFLISTNSCTTALWAILKSLHLNAGNGVKPSVILPSVTFAASSNAIFQANCTPVFADCDKSTLTISADSVQSLLSSNPASAVMYVPHGGTPQDFHSLQILTDEYEIPLVIDAAHAFGTFLENGSNVFQSGVASAMSFDITKNTTSVTGGAVATNDPQIAAFCDRFRTQGRDAQGGDYNVVSEGFHGFMIDYHAVIGLEQLKRADKLIAGRRRIAEFYDEYFADIRQQFNEGTHSWHLYSILVPNARQVQKKMKINGINCSHHYPPLHMSPFYSQFPHADDMSGSEYIEEHQLSLPLWSDMKISQARRVVNTLTEILNEMRLL